MTKKMQLKFPDPRGCSRQINFFELKLTILKLRLTGGVPSIQPSPLKQGKGRGAVNGHPLIHLFEAQSAWYMSRYELKSPNSNQIL
jgi:hypothetical protein